MKNKHITITLRRRSAGGPSNKIVRLGGAAKVSGRVKEYRVGDVLTDAEADELCEFYAHVVITSENNH